MDDLVTLLRDRFIHRSDAYALQWFNPNTREGGYVRATERHCPPDEPCNTFRCPHRISLTVTDEVLREHLAGTKTVGIYQLGEDNTVTWICIDIDKDRGADDTVDPDLLHRSAQTLATEIIRRFRLIGINALIEDSGNRGYHVWVFLSEPVAASVAQTIGHFVLENLDVPQNMHIELFPKQAFTRSYGNLIKLPLGLHLKSRRRALFVDDNFQTHPSQLSILQDVQTTSAATLLSIIRRYRLDIPQPREISAPNDEGYGRFVPLCLHRLMNDGAPDGMRDAVGFRIACYLRNRGIPRDLALSTMLQWNERNAPPMSEQLVQSKVDSAYAADYHFTPCSDPSFDPYCSAACDFYHRKQQRMTLT